MSGVQLGDIRNECDFVGNEGESIVVELDMAQAIAVGYFRRERFIVKLIVGEIRGEQPRQVADSVGRGGGSKKGPVTMV